MSKNQGWKTKQTYNVQNTFIEIKNDIGSLLDWIGIQTILTETLNYSK